MRANVLAEGIGTTKIRTVLKQGGTVYDGDPSKYEWKPSGIKNNFDSIEKLLNKVGRRFDRLVITKWANTRYFVAVSRGTPEVVYYVYYDAYGTKSNVYVDWAKFKTSEFLALSPDEQLKLLSAAGQVDPIALWKKERSVETMGAAFEHMDKSAVDAAIASIGSKLLDVVGKMKIESADIFKLAQFVRSLDTVGTSDSKKLANNAIAVYKKKAITDLLSDVKNSRVALGVMWDIGLLRKSGFDWDELNTVEKSMKPDVVKYLLTDIRSPAFSQQDSLRRVQNLKKYGFNWPELDTIEKSLTVGKKEITENLNLASEVEQLFAVKRDGLAIKSIKRPSEAVQIAAVTTDPWAIDYIKNPSENAQIAFVKRRPWGIKYLDNPSDKVKMAAVKTANPNPAITHITDPTDEMKYESVKAYPESIRWIKQPSEQLQLMAVKHDGSLIEYIKKPASKEIVITAMLKMIKDNQVTAGQFYEKLSAKYPDWPEWAAIGRSLRVDKLIKESDPAEEAKHLALVDRMPNRIKYIVNPSEAVQIAAVKKYPPALQYIKEPCKGAYITAMLAAIRANQQDFAISVYKWVKEHNPEWPELVGIEQALHKSGLI